MKRLVMIEWVASSRPDGCWLHLDDVPVLGVVECTSVGWVVGENHSAVMLVPNIAIFPGEGGVQGSGFICIPKSSVTRTIELEIDN